MMGEWLALFQKALPDFWVGIQYTVLLTAVGLLIGAALGLVAALARVYGALACLMLPIVVRSSEEMLRLVPQNLRDASYALGGSTSRTTLRVVLPKASPGIISGCLLAVARAAGETAPLIFTIGAAKRTNWNVLTGTNTSLSMQIYGNAKEAFPAAHERAWGAALTLIALAFLFTVAARIVSHRLARSR